MKQGVVIGASIVALFAAGCAKRPVLYPNDHLHEVGEEASKQDVEECVALADQADLGTNQALEAGKKTGAGAAVGGATGVVAGARLGPTRVWGGGGGRYGCRRWLLLLAIRVIGAGSCLRALCRLVS